jgi:hypothetical protein
MLALHKHVQSVHTAGSTHRASGADVFSQTTTNTQSVLYIVVSIPPPIAGSATYYCSPKVFY